MKRYFRQLLFFLYAFVLRAPIWVLIWAVGRTGIFKTVFLIYPTDVSECLDFTPNIKWLRDFFAHRPTPAGFIMHNWMPVGIYCVIASPAMELMRKKNKTQVEGIMARMRWIKKISGARTVGLAGQLGPIFEKRHGIDIEPPFYASTYGNIFSIQDAVNHLARTADRQPWNVSVAILGGGELADQLQDQLSTDGYRMSLVDVRYTRKGDVSLIDEEKADKQLSQVDFIVNLLPRGKDFLDCRVHERIPASATIIDFSRPPIPVTAVAQDVFMGNRVQRDGTRFFMRLPGWKTYELPACSMPTLVAALGGVTAASVEEFRSAARQMTFRTALATTPLSPFEQAKIGIGQFANLFTPVPRGGDRLVLQQSRIDAGPLAKQLL